MVKKLPILFFLFFLWDCASLNAQTQIFEKFRLDYVPTAFTLTPDSGELIVASEKNIYRYNYSNGNFIASFKVAKPPKDLLVSTDGKRLLMRHDKWYMPCYFDTTSSSVYELNSGKVDSRIAANIYFTNIKGPNAATLVAENKMLQGENCTFAPRSNLLWMKDGESLTGRVNSRITSLGLHSNGEYCAVVTNGKLLLVLSGDSLKQIYQRTLKEIGDYGLIFSGKHLIVSGQSNWDGCKQTVLINLESMTSDSFDFFADREVKHFCVSADGQYLALNDGFANIAIFDLLNREVVFKETIFGWIFQCNQMAFYRNSHKLLLAGVTNSNDKSGLINLFDFKDFSKRYLNYSKSAQNKSNLGSTPVPSVKDQNPYFEEDYKGKLVLLDSAIRQVVTQTSSVLQFWHWPDLLKTKELFFKNTKAYSYNSFLHRSVYISEVVAEPGVPKSFKLDMYDFAKDELFSINLSEIRSEKKLESFHFSRVELLSDTVIVLFGTVSGSTYIFSCDIKNKAGFLLEKPVDFSISGGVFGDHFQINYADKVGNKFQSFSYKPFSSDWKLLFETECPNQLEFSGMKLNLLFATYVEVWDLKSASMQKIDFPFSIRSGQDRVLFSVSPDEKLLAFAKDTTRGMGLYIYKNETWLNSHISETIYGKLTTDNKGLVFVADDNQGILQIDFNSGKQLQNVRRNDLRFNHFHSAGKYFNLGNTIYDMSTLKPAVNELGHRNIFLKDELGNYFKEGTINSSKSYSDYTTVLVEYNQLGDSLRAFILPEKETSINKAVSLSPSSHVVVEYYQLFENTSFIKVFDKAGKSVFNLKKKGTTDGFYWRTDDKGRMYILDYSGNSEKHLMLDLLTEKTINLKNNNEFYLHDTLFETSSRHISCYAGAENKKIREYYHPYYIKFSKVSYNHRKVISAMETGDVFIWSFDEDTKPELVFNPHGREPYFIKLFDSVLVSATADGEYWFYNIRTGKELFKFYSFSQQYRAPVYAFFNDSGYYTASKSVGDYIHFVYKNKAYDLQQFDAIYNRPDLVLASAGMASPEKLNVLKLAVEKRHAKMNQHSIGQLENAPYIEIINKAQLPAITSEKFLELEVYCQSNTSQLKVLHITVNDVPVYGSRGLSLGVSNSKIFSGVIRIELSSERNVIKAWCLDENGASSLSENVVIVCDVVVSPKVYLIGIGINEYQRGTNLTYAVGDIEKIADYFMWKYKENLVIDTFLNDRANRKNILSLKNLLMNTGVDDKVIVAFSGHGLLNKNLDFYFSTHEVDFKHPEDGGIALNEMELLLDSIPARQKLLLIDACHSGLVDKSVGYVRPAVAGIVEKASKGSELLIDENDSSKQLTLAFDMMQEMFQQFSNQTGTTIISAAAGREYALEDVQWKNGAFTYVLIHGLGSRKADQNEDKKITLSELKWYLSIQVPKLTGGRQRPTSRNDTNANDWVIW